MTSISLESGQLVFVRDEIEGWLPATVGATSGQGEDMSLELVHEDGTTEVSRCPQESGWIFQIVGTLPNQYLLTLQTYFS